MSETNKKDTSGGIHFGDHTQITGDVVGGDKTQIITGEGVGVGSGAKVAVDKPSGISGDELAELFAAIYQKIEARPVKPDVDKEEIKETVQKIEAEANKGSEANDEKVARWLKNLLMMAPDIFEVTVASLINPVSGIGTALRLVAERAQKEAKK